MINGFKPVMSSLSNSSQNKKHESELKFKGDDYQSKQNQNQQEITNNQINIKQNQKELNQKKLDLAARIIVMQAIENEALRRENSSLNHKFNMLG